MTPHSGPRDYSIYPVHVVGEPSHGYAPIRARSLGVGQRVEIKRTKDADWIPARRVEAPADATGGGGIVWLELL